MQVFVVVSKIFSTIRAFAFRKVMIFFKVTGSEPIYMIINMPLGKP